MSGVRIRPLHVGLAASLAAAMVLLAWGETLLRTPRELYFDELTQWLPSVPSPAIVVIDIDRKSLQEAADGTWSRNATADLIRRIAVARPKVIAVDMVFSGACDSGDPVNATLADALGQVPTILGFLIADRAGPGPVPVPPLALRRPFAVPPWWFIDGVEASCAAFQARSRSAAGTFLIGDADGRVRRIQAFSVLGQAAYPSLGLEAARLGGAGGTPMLGGKPLRLSVGGQALSLDRDGSLRLSASRPDALASRTIPAGDVLAGNVAPVRLASKVVFVGSSLPHLGGLRATAAMPLQPSMQIHADLANGLLTGFLPYRDRNMPVIEAALALLVGLGAALVATKLRPVIAAILGVASLVLMVACSAALYAATGWLADPVGPVLATGVVLALTGTMQFSRVRRAETAARQKFSQYLPRSVVARYLDNPGAGRVAGEERQVTALFTDIEGFSTLSQTMGPRELIALLDIYFAEVTALVSVHGGMVDKIVGDAVHAFFNAPEDLADHVNVAIDCAVAIRALTEEMRVRPLFAAVGFGRTRFGIETGLAVLGEVGAGGKLDYTAHGDAINLAARLQDANKHLGTSICIGPQAAQESGRRMTVDPVSSTGRQPLRPLGRHDIRGFGTMALFAI